MLFKLLNTGLHNKLKRKALQLRRRLPNTLQHQCFGVPRDFLASTKDYCEQAGYPFKLLRSNEISQRSLPATPELEIHWKFFLKEKLEHYHPDVFLAILPKGSVLGRNGAVLSPDRGLLMDVSRQFKFCPQVANDRHIFTEYVAVPRQRHLSGKIAVIAAPGSAVNFYHWLTLAFPRFQILRESGYHLEELDGFILPDGNLPAIKETLDFLRIPRQKRIQTRWESHFLADELIIPSCDTGFPPLWVCKFLRNTFLSSRSSPPNPVSAPRIYISRKESRRVFNEDKLKPILDLYGFKTIQPEKLSFLQQVKLFQQAEVIIAPHGAGLTNLVFCSPGAKVIELFSPNYVYGCFWAIANHVGVDYSYIIGEGKRPADGIDPLKRREDMIINPSKLEGWLSKFLSNGVK